MQEGVTHKINRINDRLGRTASDVRHKLQVNIGAIISWLVNKPPLISGLEAFRLGICMLVGFQRIISRANKTACQNLVVGGKDPIYQCIPNMFSNASYMTNSFIILREG
jgi:hypothetical protein